MIAGRNCFVPLGGFKSDLTPVELSAPMFFRVGAKKRYLRPKALGKMERQHSGAHERPRPTRWVLAGLPSHGVCANFS